MKKTERRMRAEIAPELGLWPQDRADDTLPIIFPTIMIVRPWVLHMEGRFRNTAVGLAALVRWLDAQGVRDIRVRLTPHTGD